MRSFIEAIGEVLILLWRILSSKRLELSPEFLLQSLASPGMSCLRAASLWVDLAHLLPCSLAFSFPVMPACPGIQQTCTCTGVMARHQREQLGNAFIVSWKAMMEPWLGPLGRPCS